MPSCDDNPDQRIWQVVAAIPRGRVATYGDVARRAGMPGAARRVGLALRRLPAGSHLPWHRVLNAAGKLSLPAGGRAERTQKTRLEAEGVVFSNNKVSLTDFRWRP